MADLAQNERATVAAPAKTCPVPMFGGKPCGRPWLGTLINDIPYCLMHTPMGKDHAAFQSEFERILREAGTGLADFTRFVFPNANYRERTFTAEFVLIGATFTQGADFYEATFTQAANFNG